MNFWVEKAHQKLELKHSLVGLIKLMKRNYVVVIVVNNVLNNLHGGIQPDMGARSDSNGVDSREILHQRRVPKSKFNR